MIQHKIQEGTVYIVQSGDSLFSIAQQAYGDGELWRAIYNANIPVIGSDPDAISPGMEIFIPILENTRYVVQKGDTLFSIAQQAYGNGNLWPAIYNANIPVIGSDPDAISPGMRLFIPILANTTYYVQRGDSLFSIAQQAYGDGNLWPAIYNANRTAIVDPDAISPGMKLSIPKV